jgi:hypothetical protein
MIILWGVFDIGSKVWVDGINGSLKNITRRIILKLWRMPSIIGSIQ